MFENLVGLKIKGGIFETEKNLEFFKEKKNNKPIRFGIVYGKNGSGKSTIARGFRNIITNTESQIETSKLIDKNNNIIPIDDEWKKIIYIFNEQFIEDNIRIDSEGLNTIIVMGTIKELDDKINQILPKYNEFINALQKQQEELDKYLDNKQILCPDYYMNEIYAKLKGENSWSSRDGKIKGRKVNSSVKQDIIEKIIKLKPLKNRDELIIDYNQKMDELNSAKIGSRKIDVIVPTIDEFESKENNIISLLREKIEKPILSEREVALFNVLQEEGGNERLLNFKKLFLDSNNTRCPFCFQEVDKKYVNELVKSIERILTKKVEEHQEKLRKEKIIISKINLSNFAELPSDLVQDCENKLDSFYTKIEEINNLLSQKIENVYKPIMIERDFGLEEKYNECKSALLKLEKEREIFNSTATNINPIIENLTAINNDIAFYDIRDLYEKYQIQYNEKSKKQQKYDRIKKEKDELQDQIDKLHQEKRNVNIAMKKINDDLSYIFYSKNRLKIEFKNDKYILYSHGKAVQPENISVGERNAIALCYFFNHIMENRDERYVYKGEYILIIDDPVSSFDMENRIGILSYLKYKLGQFFMGNDTSKFLVLTHDLQTFNDTKKLMCELISSRYTSGNESKADLYITSMELLNNTLITLDDKKRSEYTSLLGMVFEYGKNINSETTIIIGNVMRKILEAFGTFTYKKGMAQLSTDDKIISNFSENDRIYYSNLMYRLILNSSSHMEEKVKSMNDLNFFDYVSDSEKQRTAKDIICFLFKLNPIHVKAHLQAYYSGEDNPPNVEEIINEWCKLQ